MLRKLGRFNVTFRLIPLTWFICALLNLCTETPATSWMLELFEEVGGDVPEYFSLGNVFEK